MVHLNFLANSSKTRGVSIFNRTKNKENQNPCHLELRRVWFQNAINAKSKMSELTTPWWCTKSTTSLPNCSRIAQTILDFMSQNLNFFLMHFPVSFKLWLHFSRILKNGFMDLNVADGLETLQAKEIVNGNDRAIMLLEHCLLRPYHLKNPRRVLSQFLSRI
jgi:hypothetical protein